MAKSHAKGIPTWLKIVLGVTAAAAIFCLIILVIGGCTGQTFLEVLTPAKEIVDVITPEPEVVESAETAMALMI